MTAALLAAIAVLAAANLYFDSSNLRIWAVPLATVAWLTAAWSLAYWRSSAGARGPASALVQQGLLFGVLIVYAALAAQVTNAISLTADPEVARRITMALVGAFFAVTGNALPKVLVPRMTTNCARAQAMHRFTGWIWVLTGIAMAAAWLTLPLPVAKAISLALMLGSSLLVIMRAVTFQARQHAA